MSEKQQMRFMQVRMIRLAAERWGKDISTVSKILSENGVFRYISDCFGILHVEGDMAVLEDIESYLAGRGVAYD